MTTTNLYCRHTQKNTFTPQAARYCGKTGQKKMTRAPYSPPLLQTKVQTSRCTGDINYPLRRWHISTQTPTTTMCECNRNTPLLHPPWSCNFVFYILGEISQQLSDGLPLNGLHTFMVPWGCFCKNFYTKISTYQYFDVKTMLTCWTKMLNIHIYICLLMMNMLASSLWAC